jgi:hypothetical protein
MFFQSSSETDDLQIARDNNSVQLVLVVSDPAGEGETARDRQPRGKFLAFFRCRFARWLNTNTKEKLQLD